MPLLPRHALLLKQLHEKRRPVHLMHGCQCRPQAAAIGFGQKQAPAQQDFGQEKSRQSGGGKHAMLKKEAFHRL